MKDKSISIITLLTIIGLMLALSLSSPYEKISHEFTLDNGMRFLLIPNHKVPAVTHMVWYQVGAADEKPGKSGFAHLFEHLMFKGTNLLQSGELSRLVSYYGGDDNAFTGQNFTAYFQTIAKEHLPLVMMMEAERMQNLILNEDVVNRERAVVLEERSMRTDNDPSALFMEQVNKALYQSHPYGTPVIGWRDEVEKLSLADTDEFYHRYYQPCYATVVVSGDTDVHTLKILAQKYYGNLKSPTQCKKLDRSNITAAAPAITNNRVNYKDNRVRTPQWVKLYQAPSAHSGKTQYAMPLNILANTLGGETGRLYQSLVIEKKIATSASVYYNDISYGPTSFGIYITPKDGVEFQTIEAAVNQEIDALLKYGLSEEEIQHHKLGLTADFIYSKDGFKSMAFIYGHVISNGLHKEYVENWVNNINDVQEQQIMRAAKKVLTNNNFVIGTLDVENNEVN